MTHLEGLVTITQTYMRMEYADETTCTVGDVARNVRRVSENLIQWFSPDMKEQHELLAIIELCKRFNIDIAIVD